MIAGEPRVADILSTSVNDRCTWKRSATSSTSATSHGAVLRIMFWKLLDGYTNMNWTNNVNAQYHFMTHDDTNNSKLKVICWSIYRRC